MFTSTSAPVQQPRGLPLLIFKPPVLGEEGWRLNLRIEAALTPCRMFPTCTRMTDKSTCDRSARDSDVDGLDGTPYAQQWLFDGDFGDSPRDRVLKQLDHFEDDARVCRCCSAPETRCDCCGWNAQGCTGASKAAEEGAAAVEGPEPGRRGARGGRRRGRRQGGRKSAAAVPDEAAQSAPIAALARSANRDDQMSAGCQSTSTSPGDTSEGSDGQSTPESSTPRAAKQNDAAQAPADGPLFWPEGATTVMLKNIPNRYTVEELLAEILAEGFEDTFDFLYLPIDFCSKRNRGYAFVNFKEPAIAEEFMRSFHEIRLTRYPTQKILQVAPALTQGFEANMKQFVRKDAQRIQNRWFRPMIFGRDEAGESETS